MNFIALVSGGKDSIFSIIQCIAQGHKLICLANLYPKTSKETDSYMYQTVGSEMINAISEAIGVPLFRKEITGSAINTDMKYIENEKDEVEDLYILIKEIISKYELNGIKIQGISAGAILSNYQKLRVENICARLNLKILAPLWNLDQSYLLRKCVLDWQVDAIIIKVCTLGLDNKHLGKHLKDLVDYLESIVFYKINITKI